MAIILTAAQLLEMQTRFGLNSEKPNYAGMYQFIFEQVGNQMPTEQRYWFEQAAKINAYLNDVTHVPPEASSYFIQRSSPDGACGIRVFVAPIFPDYAELHAGYLAQLIDVISVQS